MRINHWTSAGLPLPLVTSVLSRPESIDSLCLQSQTKAEWARDSYHRELTRCCLQRGALGGVLGYALLGHDDMIGPLVGAAVGVFTAWEKLHREKTGTVSVELDGRTYQKPFWGNPRQMELNPQEAHFQLLGQGEGSPSRVNAFVGRVAEPDAENLAAWKEQSSALRQLGEQRRLVACLGQTTEDGQSAVLGVDSLTAVKVAAAGGKVFLVNARAPKDVEHSLTMVGFNRAHSQGDSQEVRYLERVVDYSLIPVQVPGDVNKAAAGAQGIPEGMFGLLENATRYAEVVNYGRQQDRSEMDSPEFGTGSTSQSNWTSSNLQTRVTDHALRFEGGLDSCQQVNLPGLLALIGTTAGLITALACTGPGVPGPALLAATVGFLSGRAAGRALLGG